MSSQTFFFWGMLVTVFLIIAAVLTIREVVECYLEARRENASGPAQPDGSD